MHSDELIREVDEELQRDRLLTYWRRYGGIVVTAAVASVLVTTAVVGWQAWTRHRQLAEASTFSAADRVGRTSGPVEGAKALETFAAGADPGWAAVARLTAATVQSTAGDQAAAERGLAAVAADSKADPLFRDLSSLLVIAREIDAGEPKALIARLQPLTAAGAPWRHYGRQLLAAAQLRAGERVAAARTLTELAADAEAPASLRRRARELGDAIASAGSSAS